MQLGVSLTGGARTCDPNQDVHFSDVSFFLSWITSETGLSTISLFRRPNADRSLITTTKAPDIVTDSSRNPNRISLDGLTFDSFPKVSQSPTTKAPDIVTGSSRDSNYISLDGLPFDSYPSVSQSPAKVNNVSMMI